MTAPSKYRLLFYGLWLPVLWTTFLACDIVMFAGGRPSHIILRLFEDMVFVMSFLFYGVDFYSPNPVQLFLRYFMQFLLWWVVGISSVWAYNRKNKL